LSETEGTCPEGRHCIHHSFCPEAIELRKIDREEFRSNICNKKELGYCCPPGSSLTNICNIFTNIKNKI
jgi:hypothetical protein